MDLSLLEGPPLADPRIVVPVDPPFPRIQAEPPTPGTGIPGQSYHTLYTKPLPPRPASADPLDLRQARHQSSDNNHASAAHDTSSHGDRHLRRMPARRGRRDVSNELHPPGEGLTAEDPVREARSRSPPSNLYLNMEFRVPRRPRSAPLVWVEDEEMWVVTEDSTSSPGPATRHNRTPRLATQTSEPIRRIENVAHEDPGRRPLSPPPSYESHGFTHTHVVQQQRTAMSPWGAVAQRMHHLSNG